MCILHTSINQSVPVQNVPVPVIDTDIPSAYELCPEPIRPHEGFKFPVKNYKYEYIIKN